MTISEYILKKLKEYNCKYVFGIPATSCSDFFMAIDEDKDIDYIVTTSELEAGFIADGYGRNKRLGALCVSYGVGTLSLVNAVASSLTEKVPVIIINGGPSFKDKELEKNIGSLFSHSNGKPNSDYNILKELTVDSHIINDLNNAKQAIDECFFNSFYRLGPVYLEIPQDLWKKEIPNLQKPVIKENYIKEYSNFSDLYSLFSKKINDSKKPIILIGCEIVRRDLIHSAQKLIEKLQIPFYTTSLSKSSISEGHPLFIGVYDSDLFPKPSNKFIEESDCIIALGVI